MTDALRNGLYLFSNALLLPVLVLMLAVAAWTVVLAGGLLREWMTRRAVRETFAHVKSLLKAGEGGRSTALSLMLACADGVPALFCKIQRGWPLDETERDKCLEDLESEVAASLSKLTWITRVGPMLGLMGTLIPLGPALTGLASGNMAALSSNLVVAFTTTVIGVFAGCSAFTMHLIRRNWYNRDMSDMEYILERLVQPLDAYATQEKKVG